MSDSYSSDDLDDELIRQETKLKRQSTLTYRTDELLNENKFNRKSTIMEKKRNTKELNRTKTGLVKEMQETRQKVKDLMKSGVFKFN